MKPREHELKTLLARREPSPDFTARIMAAVRAETDQARKPVEFPAPAPKAARRPVVFRWAAVGAMAASLVFAVLTVRHQREEKRAAERAEAQLIESLSFAGAKISMARDKVWGAPRGD
jgi:negative regulator of sigma E activity